MDHIENCIEKLLECDGFQKKKKKDSTSTAQSSTDYLYHSKTFALCYLLYVIPPGKYCTTTVLTTRSCREDSSFICFIIMRAPLAPASAAGCCFTFGFRAKSLLDLCFWLPNTQGYWPMSWPPVMPRARLQSSSIPLGQEVGWPQHDFPSRKHFPSPFRHLQLAAVLPS